MLILEHRTRSQDPPFPRYKVGDIVIWDDRYAFNLCIRDQVRRARA